MKVFLSSTYADLIPYRTAAKTIIERLGLQAGAMEGFCARPEEPKQACCDEIARCDLFVGIYAHRYGFVPPGEIQSITELEYDHAKRLGRPLFCFLVDECQPWPPAHIEGEPGKSQLAAFKARAGLKTTHDTFTTPEDLAMKIATALAAYAGRTASDAPAIPKPRRAELPRTRTLYGRERELATIAAALQPTARTWGVLIAGPGGIGKTALAVRAAHAADGFDTKLFLSARRRDLTPAGERSRADFALGDVAALLDELGRALGAEDVPRASPAERPRVARRAVAIYERLDSLDLDAARQTLAECEQAVG